MSELSEGQKSCLRLVARGMSSKEIAKETGLTPYTVDTYLKACLARLGASNRREAARLFAEWELSQKLGSPSAAIAQQELRVEDAFQTDDGRRAIRFTLPPVGGATNELTWAQKTYEALRVAAVSAAMVIALSLVIAGLLQTFR